MSSNYFEKLKLQARELDNGIEKLIKTWKLPQLLVGGFAECTNETNVHIKAIWDIIQNTQNEIEQTLSEINSEKADGKETLTMEQFLQENKEEYNDLKTQCDNLDIVLAEYGYHFSDDDTTN